MDSGDHTSAPITISQNQKANLSGIAIVSNQQPIKYRRKPSFKDQSHQNNPKVNSALVMTNATNQAATVFPQTLAQHGTPTPSSEKQLGIQQVNGNIHGQTSPGNTINSSIHSSSGKNSLNRRKSLTKGSKPQQQSKKGSDLIDEEIVMSQSMKSHKIESAKGLIVLEQSSNTQAQQSTMYIIQQKQNTQENANATNQNWQRKIGKHPESMALKSTSGGSAVRNGSLHSTQQGISDCQEMTGMSNNGTLVKILNQGQSPPSSHYFNAGVATLSTEMHYLSTNSPDKNVKRKGTMPVSNNTANMAATQAAVAALMLQQQQQQMMYQDHRNSYVDSSRAQNSNTQIISSSGTYGSGITGANGLLPLTTSATAAVSDQSTGFLPDIYMTSTAAASGKGSIGGKQNNDAVKRLIKKTKQFILIEDSTGNQRTYKRVIDDEGQNQNGAANFRATDQKFAGIQNDTFDDTSIASTSSKSGGYSQLMRQKNTPKSSIKASNEKLNSIHSKSQHRPNNKIGSSTDSSNIMLTTSSNQLVTCGRSPPQQSIFGGVIDSYYNMVISPKQNSQVNLNDTSPNVHAAGSPMLSASQNFQNRKDITASSVHSSLTCSNGNNLGLNIISQTGSKIVGTSANPAYHQSPQVKSTPTRLQPPVRKVSLEEAMLETNGVAGQGSNNTYFNNNSKDTFSQTAQIVSKTSKTSDKKPTFSAYSEETKDQQVFMSKRNIPNPPPDNKSKETQPKVTMKGPKQSQKSMKLVYKQMRESNDKSKVGSKIFSSMDDQINQWGGAAAVTPPPNEDPSTQSHHRPGVNYEQYIQPRTERVYQFQSKRVDFRRRQLNMNNQVLVLQFEGVIGEIMQRNLGDEYYQIALRHGAIEGLKELAKNFQLVIFSHMNERYCNHIIDLFDRENIVFDAFYQRVKAFKRTDEYCNYNQVYLDFEVCSAASDEDHADSRPSSSLSLEPSPLTQKSSVQNSVLIVSPLCLDNEEIKEREGENLLYQDKVFSSMQTSKRNLNLKGLPIDTPSQQKPPVILLVPHLRSQVGNCSTSMINISNIISSLLVTSCIVKEEQIKDMKTEADKDQDTHFRQLREEERIKQQIQLQMNSNSRSPSPKRSGAGQIKTQSTIQQKGGGGLFMMTITTISPKNHFKKILASTKDKILDQKTCTWLYAFYQIKKYKLFSLKTASSMKFIPEHVNKRREEEILKLKQTVFKLNALLKTHTTKTQQGITNQTFLASDTITSNPKSQVMISELLQGNEWAKQSVFQYKNDYYKNLIQLLANHPQASLQDLIQELQDRINDLESCQQLYSLGNVGNDNGSATGDQPLLHLYRFLVLQGSQFQNYPIEVKSIIKERETTLQRNLFNWVVVPVNRGAQNKGKQQQNQMIMMSQGMHFKDEYH